MFKKIDTEIPETLLITEGGELRENLETQEGRFTATGAVSGLEMQNHEPNNY